MGTSSSRTDPSLARLGGQNGNARLLVISPVRNEARHLVATAQAVASQQRPPDAWVIVDDGSSDGTLAVARSLTGEIPFLRVLSMPVEAIRRVPDRLALAKEARAFNFALRRVDRDSFTHIGKLDGDVELPPEWFRRLLGMFEADPRLGIAGGRLVERTGRGWKQIAIPSHHVHGAVKLYRRDCLEAIGGVAERLAWDTVDETYARMRGFRTLSFGDLVARHHRPWGSADGQLRGRARHGECAYVLHYGLPWVGMRALKVATKAPPGLSGFAFVYGYLRAAARSVPRVEDDEFRRFVRRELRARLSGRYRRLTPFDRPI